MPLSPNERKQIRQLIDEAGGIANPSGWFEPLYRQAQGDTDEVPWANLAPNPYLVDWLQSANDSIENQRALVIGCGLGDDAEALSQAGYTVTAFDISETAIAWCQQRFPDSSVTYEVGDMFAPKPEWTSHFNLVFECRNFQALPIEVRAKAMEAIARCVAPAGTFVIITNHRQSEDIPEGPPGALSDGELALFQQLGFTELERQPFGESTLMSSKLRLVLRQG